MKNRFMLAPLTNTQSHADGRMSDEEFKWLTMRAEGGFWSAAFDVATNRFTAVSCENCGFTELYRTNVGAGSKIFDFLVS